MQVTAPSADRRPSSLMTWSDLTDSLIMSRFPNSFLLSSDVTGTLMSLGNVQMLDGHHKLCSRHAKHMLFTPGFCFNFDENVINNTFTVNNPAFTQAPPLSSFWKISVGLSTFCFWSKPEAKTGSNLENRNQDHNQNQWWYGLGCVWSLSLPHGSRLRSFTAA